MNTYFDTGVLVKNYCHERNSQEAIALILAERPPFPLTHLLEAELRNAFRLKLFRGEITASQVHQSLNLLDEDIQEGRFELTRPDEGDIYRRTERLSQLHTAQLGTRLPDIIHVAAALAVGSSRFVSFDQQQRAIAKKAGLTVLPKP